MSIFSSPIGRLAFLGRYILAILLLALGGTILDFGHGNFAMMLLYIALDVLGFIYFIGFVMFPRLVSVGLSRLFTLVLIVPLINLLFVLFLLFCPAGWLIKRD